MPAHTTVGDIRAIMEDAYPPELAEPWDQVGLICGDPSAPVQTVAFALDCTFEVATRAVAAGADMLICHHPLLLRGVHSVAADTPKGAVIHALIAGGCALFAAHTNADSARPGVNDELARRVGISSGRPIVPHPAPGVDKWGVHVPAEYAEAVKTAVFAAGAGTIGNYTHCAYTLDGRGQFQPTDAATPFDGTPGELSFTEEQRVEFVAPARRREAIRRALHDSHPYEEPAYDVIPLAVDTDLATACGLGRVGELPEPMRLADFVQRVADGLPATAWGVRATGDPEQMVHRVAVSSGAGDSLLDTVRHLGVDVYVTSDLRHHPVDEYLRAGGPAVVDTAHWASEFPWVHQARSVVDNAVEVQTTIIDVRTDPWTQSAHPCT